ncbi:MAG: hypothetical protein WAL31_05165 [Gaiellaceae bacterium]
MGLGDFMRKVFSGKPHVAGGDPETEAILREEYGAGDPDVPLEGPAHSTMLARQRASVTGGPVGAGSAEAALLGGEVGEAGEDAIEATDAPSDPTP